MAQHLPPPASSDQPGVTGIVVIMSSGHYPIGVTQGVFAYAGRRTQWQVRLLQRRGDETYADFVADAPLRGVIVQVFHPREAEVFRAAGIPAVNVSDFNGSWALPTVISDNRAIGVMAAEHFLELGFGHFAFCADERPWYALRRRDGFVGRVEQDGRSVQEYFPTSRGPDLMADMVRWLQRLPRPVGLMTHNDVWAMPVMRACERAGLEVPRDVAVLGVDNDVGICETWRVPISSVAVNAEKIGYEAAALLDRMMRGEPPPAEPIEIPPICVEQRESTAGLGVRDRAVAKAVSAMREGIDQPLTIDGLAAALGLSRRHLDRRFHEALGRTAAEELRRLRVERARRLLKETNKNVLQVALDCGFCDANRLTSVFRATLGMSPTAYRRQHQTAVSDMQ